MYQTQHIRDKSLLMIKIKKDTLSSNGICQNRITQKFSK